MSLFTKAKAPQRRVRCSSQNTRQFLFVKSLGRYHALEGSCAPQATVNESRRSFAPSVCTLPLRVLIFPCGLGLRLMCERKKGMRAHLNFSGKLTFHGACTNNPSKCSFSCSPSISGVNSRVFFDFLVEPAQVSLSRQFGERCRTALRVVTETQPLSNIPHGPQLGRHFLLDFTTYSLPVASPHGSRRQSFGSFQRRENRSIIADTMLLVVWIESTLAFADGPASGAVPFGGWSKSSEVKPLPTPFFWSSDEHKQLFLRRFSGASLQSYTNFSSISIG